MATLRFVEEDKQAAADYSQREHQEGQDASRRISQLHRTVPLQAQPEILDLVLVAHRGERRSVPPKDS
jgi:hypothetical protein